MPENALPTGLDILDDLLDGGILPGSIIALVAAPTSQSERFLAALTRPRPTRYLTTQRSTDAITGWLDWNGVDSASYRVEAVNAEDPLAHAHQLVGDVSDASTVIIDCMNPLETADDHGLSAFLNTVKHRVTATDSIAVLHCLDGHRVPNGRDTTTYMADVIFELETDTYGEAIENRLFIPKVRRGESLNQAVKLDLSSTVRIDTSRDLA